MTQDFKHILAPGKIGNVTVKNRFFRSGAGMLFCHDDGFVTEEARKFYSYLARGGTGLITVGPASACHGAGIFDFENYQFWDDRFIPGMAELADIIHTQGDGAVCFMQLLHAGPMHQMFIDKDGLTPVSASCLPEGEIPDMIETSYYPPMPYLPYHELTVDEIHDIQTEFIDAAERAKKAGFDGVEINGAAVHLINTFFSKAWNRRHDEYGCDSLENRARMEAEIISGIKKRCGNDFPVVARLNLSEFGHPLGTTIDEACGMAKILEKAGADAIHGLMISYGKSADVWQWQDCAYYPELPAGVTQNKEVDWSDTGKGAALPLAAKIKSAVNIPVICINRMDPWVGDAAIAEGKCDFVGMQRRLIADPWMPKKIAEGRIQDIAPCTACTTCISVHGPVHCRVNGAMGYTDEYEVQPAKAKKKVAVVGAGPAGMEAARTAALRGHDVTLYSSARKLGGSMPLAAAVKGTKIENIPDLISYFEYQLGKLGVKVVAGKNVTPNAVLTDKPDCVIVATGGKEAQPDIPGIKRKIVLSNEKLHGLLESALKVSSPEFLHKASKIWMPVGKSVAVIGGSMAGLELAEFLAKNGRRVTVVEESQMPGWDMPMMKTGSLLYWFNQNGVKVMAGTKVKSIEEFGLIVEAADGTVEEVYVDNVITCLPLEPDTSFANALEGKVPEVYTVGDCRHPANIAGAVQDAHNLTKHL